MCRGEKIDDESSEVGQESVLEGFVYGLVGCLDVRSDGNQGTNYEVVLMPWVRWFGVERQVAELTFGWFLQYSG